MNGYQDKLAAGPMAASREPHHQRLENTLYAMSEVVEQLQLLLTKIQHGVSDQPNQLPRQLLTAAEITSLVSVLHSAPDRIREATNKQLGLINEINELLF
jgi:hypothetical protein